MRRIISIISSTIFFIIPISSVSAQTTPPPANINDIETVFSTFLQVVLTLVAISTLIVIVLAGFRYLSAGGDKEATHKAKLTLTFGVAGLLVALSAWIIIQMIYNFTGVDFARFNICVAGGC